MDTSISRRQLLATLATTPLLARAGAQTADVPTAAAAAPAVGAAPIVEEVVYRLMLQGALLRVTRRPWVAVLATIGCRGRTSGCENG